MSIQNVYLQAVLGTHTPRSREAAKRCGLFLLRVAKYHKIISSPLSIEHRALTRESHGGVKRRAGCPFLRALHSFSKESSGREAAKRWSGWWLC